MHLIGDDGRVRCTMYTVYTYILNIIIIKYIMIIVCTVYNRTRATTEIGLVFYRNNIIIIIIAIAENGLVKFSVVFAFPSQVFRRETCTRA